MIDFARRAGRLLALAPATALLAQPALAQDDAEWAESPQFFLVSEVPEGVRTYVEYQNLVQVPTRWLRAVRLTDPVTLEIGEKQHAFAAGDVLPQVVFMPDGTQESLELAYCSPRNRGENTTRSGVMGSLFGGTLWDSLARDATDTQFCLRDTDGDGRFDASFLVGEGENNFIRGGAVDGVGFENADGAEISREDHVSLALVSSGRRNVEFTFTIVQQGHTIDFTDFSSGPYRAFARQRFSVRDGYPVPVDIAGFRFNITAHDRDADNVTVEWQPASGPEQVMLPENYRRY